VLHISMEKGGNGKREVITREKSGKQGNIGVRNAPLKSQAHMFQKKGGKTVCGRREWMAI